MYLPRRRTRRPVPVDAHEGEAVAFLQRHTREAADAARAAGAAGAAAAARVCAAMFDRIFDTRNLFEALLHILHEGGRARGADGIGPRDLDTRAQNALIRSLSMDLKAGRYRPGPVRTIERPKPNGGTRTISILTVPDRVVQRAIVQVVQPFVDPGFDPNSLGGRPGRSREEALARAAHLSVAGGRRVWTTADVGKAFDRVPHDRLMQTVRNRLGATRVAGLIDLVVRTGRTVGVAQGGALSMFLMNLLLDEVLDRPWLARHPDTPLIRWVDDILIISTEKEVAHARLEELNTLLAGIGMPLKPAPAQVITDLRENSAHWLGYELTAGPDGLTARIVEGAWDELEAEFQGAHDDALPSNKAAQIAMAWVDCLGPCLPQVDTRAAHARIGRILTDLDLDEARSTLTEQQLGERWRRAYARYEGKRQQLREEDEQHRNRVEEERSTTAPPVGTLANLVPVTGESTDSPLSTPNTPAVSGPVTPVPDHRSSDRTGSSTTNHGLGRAAFRPSVPHPGGRARFGPGTRSQAPRRRDRAEVSPRRPAGPGTSTRRPTRSRPHRARPPPASRPTTTRPEHHRTALAAPVADLVRARTINAVRGSTTVEFLASARRSLHGV